MSHIDEKEHAVLLVHGIREIDLWFDTIRPSLERHGFLVCPTNYGRYDLFRFLYPFKTFRKKAEEKVFRQIRDHIKANPSVKFSIIAHSFGSYIVSRILENQFDLNVSRIIFVGSVVSYDFPFEQFSDRFKGEILNEVGRRDPWPVLAESLTFGYGSAGTFGFSRPRVYDRMHNGGHSDVINEKHCEYYWIPFLNNGEVVRKNEKGRVPFQIKLLHILKIKYVVLTLLFAMLFVSAIRAASIEPITIREYNEDPGWRITGVTLDAINSQINKKCPVSWLFGGHCRSWIAKKITGRNWRKLDYDDKVSRLFIPRELKKTYHDPESFWFEMRDRHPECISINIELVTLISVNYLDSCKLEVSNEAK